MSYNHNKNYNADDDDGDVNDDNDVCSLKDIFDNDLNFSVTKQLFNPDCRKHGIIRTSFDEVNIH
jgi:hypothetical protein